MQTIRSITRTSFRSSSIRLSIASKDNNKVLPLQPLQSIVHISKANYASGPTVENDDPTPDKKEGGPDRESIPGDAGGTKSVSESDAAFDPNSPRPQDSAAKIEKETDKDMSRSAASNMPSDSATGQKQKKVPENKGRS